MAIALAILSGLNAGHCPAAAPGVESAAADVSWSRFRGPSGMGVSTSGKLPITWSATENLAWKTPLPGPGASSPVVFGNRIYLTCYTGFFVPDQPGGSPEQLQRHLLAVDRRTGTIEWNQSVAARLPEEDRIRDHGFAANTPAVDADYIYAFFGKSGVYAFDHNGKQVWHTDVGDKTNGWGTSASPVLYQDLVLINASVESQSLLALDRRTGEIRWRQNGIRESWNTPLVVKAGNGRDELVVAVQGKVLAFDPTSGTPLWNCATDISWYMVPSVIAHEGIVYCLGGRSGVAALAVRTGGSGDVTATHRLWTGMKGSNVTSPVFRDGHLYWVHEQQGIAFCADAATGKVVYEQRLNRAGQVYASALLAEDRVYYLTREGRMFVVAAEPEFRQLAMNDLSDGSVFNGSPAVADEQLILRSDKFLYCIGR